MMLPTIAMASCSIMAGTLRSTCPARPILSGELAKLNETAKSLDIPNIIVAAPEEKASKKPN
jgi:hypothetical protein